MRSMILRLLRVNANFYYFLSGVFLTISINLYTGIFSSNELPGRWKVLITSIILTLVSSLFWSAIAWELDAVQKLVISESPGWMDSDTMLLKLTSQKRFRLLFFYLISI